MKEYAFEAEAYRAAGEKSVRTVGANGWNKRDKTDPSLISSAAQLTSISN